MRLLKEPLLHFFVIGAALFPWFQIVAPETQPSAPADTIAFDQDDVALLNAQFEARWNRTPSPTELQALLENAVREEVLVREARALGLDRGDSVIRARLSQKMGFLTDSIAASIVPTDEALDAFLDQNAARYETPDKLAFVQVFLGEAPSEAMVEQTLTALRAQQDPSAFGVATLLPRDMPLTATRGIDAVFGPGFASRLSDVETGSWIGPVRSGYGAHLVRVQAVEPGTVPPLTAIHDTVVRDWRAARRDDLAQAQYQALAQKYQISTPDLADQDQ